ncbi:MAG: acyl-CoA dehydrogenase family protein, partial [Actinobacteria bacterium]|nr:acyl-CoA dehydrogenase family protein [Actinomycetota bacterium]
MDFDIPDEYEELQRNLVGFVDRELRPLEDEYLDPERDDVPVELRDRVRRRSAELGFYAADFPEDLGGSGLPQLGMVLLREAAARTGSRLAAFTTYGPEGPTGLLLSGTDEQKKQYLMPLITAEKSMCFALTEPDAGSDAQNIQTTAVKDGNEWILNGRKHFITNGKHADFALVFAANDRSKKAQGGITAFIVEKGTPGFEVGRGQVGMVEGEGQFELIFDDCRVSEEQILGGPQNEGMGFYSAMQFLAMGRLSIAAGCNGIADYALGLGIDYAKQRVAFDRPIGKNQYVQGHIVESAVELKASKLMTYECAWKYDQGDAVIQESSMVKLYATEMVNRVVDRMIQVHGGMGWMREVPLERLYRFVRIFTLVEGTSEIQKYIIAKTL